MNYYNDILLCERYPEIFKNRHNDLTKTAMCWGFECGDGWFWLIDAMCEQLLHKKNHIQDQIKYCRVKLEIGRAHV